MKKLLVSLLSLPLFFLGGSAFAHESYSDHLLRVMKNKTEKVECMQYKDLFFDGEFAHIHDCLLEKDKKREIRYIETFNVGEGVVFDSISENMSIGLIPYDKPINCELQYIQQGHQFSLFATGKSNCD